MSPGSRNTPLVMAVAQTSEITSHVVLDERSAGFFALGMARALGEPVALLCTSGSAGAHYLPALIEAYYSNIPLLALTADRPAELQDCGAPQTVAQSQMFGAHVRASFELQAPYTGMPQLNWLSTLATRAVEVATGAVPGPVHLNVPFREPLWEPAAPVDDHAVKMPPRILRGENILSPAVVAMLADRLAAQERGVFVCGPMAPDARQTPRLRTALTQLAECLGWPILAEPTSQLRFALPNDQSLITSYDLLLREQTWAHSMAPSCVVRIGQLPTSKALQEWLAREGSGKTILIEATGAWRDPAHSADTLLVAEPAQVFEQLLNVLTARRAASTYLQQWRRAEQLLAPKIAAACSDDLLWEGAVARQLVESLPAGASLHVASSMPVRDLDAFAPSLPRVVNVYANRGANGIDGTLASAFGAASVAGEGPLWVLMGDLAFFHDASSLALARDTRATVVILNNGGGGIFDFLPIAASLGDAPAFQRFFTTEQQIDIGALCVAYGAVWKQVTTMSEMKHVFAQRHNDLKMSGHGVLVIEVAIARQANVARHRAIVTQAKELVHGS